MHFYTSFTQVKNKILVRGWKDGKRFTDEIRYKPYLFVRSPNPSEFKTLKGQFVQKMDFDSITDARDFVNKYKDVSNFPIFGLTQYPYACINDNFPGTVEFDATQINVVYIDIEVQSDGGFPDVSKADRPVTAISLMKGDQVFCFGLGDYKPSNEKYHYLKCKSEKHLLEKFLAAWQILDIDVVSGWNVEMFDMPYIITRIQNVLGNEEAKKISPHGLLYTRTIKFANKDVEVPNPIGFAILDYLQLYKRFAYTPQESYRLDHIAHYELGKGKLDYSEYGSLTELYTQNHQKFIEYNIQDSIRVKELNDKLGFIEQVFAIAYDAKVNYSDSLTTVRLWDTIIHNHLLDQKIVVPHVEYDDNINEGGIIGGYVKDPQLGLWRWVLSFDLTSLYPMIMRMYNISPETFRGVLPVDGNDSEEKVLSVLNGLFNKEEYRKALKDQNIVICASGCTFDRDYQGFLPALVARIFNQRDIYKKKMIESKKQLEHATDENRKQIEADVAKWNNLQMAKKIQINSLYGALANRFFRWYEPRFAESITMCGQLTTRWIERKLNLYFNNLLKTKDVDYIIACDTDSVYINAGPLVEKVGSKAKDKIDFLDKVCKEALTPYIDKSFDELAEYMNAFEQHMSMKREAIANKGIWTGKKHYILNVFDQEGVRYTEPKLKMMGIEAVRSSTPAACRVAIKDAISLIMNKEIDDLRTFIKNLRDNFRSLPFEEIAFPRGVKELARYSSNDTIYGKGTPIHSRAALLFNYLLKDKGLSNKYEPIYDGDKIKFCYLTTPNPLCENVVAIKHTLPPDFGLHAYIDYETQFEKGFMTPIRSITKVMEGWDIDEQSTLTDYFR